MKMTLHHINFVSTDVAKLNDFYRNVMGLAARGLAAWRAWRAVAPWLEGLVRGLRRARVPGER